MAHNPNAGAYYSKAAELTKSDSTALTVNSQALYVSGTGDVKVTTTGGSVVTFKAVPAGTIIPIGITLLWSTGTTATLVVALYN